MGKWQLTGLDTGSDGLRMTSRRVSLSPRRRLGPRTPIGLGLGVSIHAATAALILALSATLSAQTSVVADVKAALVARGVPLSDGCGAFQITKRVAWQLRGTGVGLLSKPGGNNCEGYSVDFLTLPDGSGYDILGDAGGANVPGWELAEPAGALTGRWRAPFDPGDVVAPPPPGPPVEPPAPVGDVAAVLQRLTILEQGQAMVLAVATETLNQVKAHRAGVQAVWLKVSAIAGPLVSILLTWLKMRGGA